MVEPKRLREMVHRIIFQMTSVGRLYVLVLLRAAVDTIFYANGYCFGPFFMVFVLLIVEIVFLVLLFLNAYGTPSSKFFLLSCHFFLLIVVTLKRAECNRYVFRKTQCVEKI